MPLGNPLLNTIWHLEQVSRESSEDMIVLGIRSESGVAWKPAKGNRFYPTKRRLYKGLKHTNLEKLGKGETESETQGNIGEQGESRRGYWE